MLKVVFRLLGLFVLISCTIVLILRSISPPTSAFMVLARLQHNLIDKNPLPQRYSWVNYQAVSGELPIALIASEDQAFASHNGFDFQALAKAWQHNSTHHRHLRGGSTITQQVAKNLFLWPGRSYIRKIIEAYFTVLIELCWTKRRIIEIYMNIAQFGDNIFGVRAASQAFFGKSPASLSSHESALLAAVLPNPVRYLVKQPSARVIKRQQWILRQMHILKEQKYLNQL
jgi:monofunctional glycosyltransferase